VSREVSPALSAHVTTLLRAELKLRKHSGKYSQNQMAKEIGIPGGTLSNVMTGTKGIGDDVLPKIAVFLRKTRESLEAELETLTPVHATDPASGTASLAQIRRWLYKRYPKTLVDQVVSMFYPTELDVSELDALDVLDHQIRIMLAGGKAEGESHLASPKDGPREERVSDHPSFTPIQRERIDRQAKQLAKGRAASGRGKDAGK
jgi:transcriptional regulator with XRE-family HTH domain